MEVKPQTKQIGITHILTQILVLGIISGGSVFVLLIALAEITGWILLGLWLIFDFFVLPQIQRFLDKTFSQTTILFSLLKMILLGLAGGIIAFLLFILYYRFHMFYINAGFNISTYYKDFIPMLIVVFMLISIGELVRRLVAFIKAKKN